VTLDQALSSQHDPSSPVTEVPVVLTWNTGAPALKANLGTPTLIDQGPAVTDIIIRVTFPDPGPTNTIVASSIGFTQFTFGGSGNVDLSFNQGARPEVQADGRTFRYHVKGSYTDATNLTALFTGSWQVQDSTAQHNVTTVNGSGSAPITVEHAFALNVKFPASAALDVSSLQTFKQVTLDGQPGLGSLVIDAAVPATVLGDHVTVQYRVNGQLGTGDLAAHFAPGSWKYAAPVAPSQAAQPVPTPPTTYLDIQYTPTIGGGPVTFTGPANTLPFTIQTPTGSTIALVTTTQTKLGPNLYRYYLTGTYHTGDVHVVFTSGGVSDGNTFTNVQCTNAALCTQSFTVLGPTAKLVDPADGVVVGANQLNVRGYIDIPFVAPTGLTVDPTTISKVDFTLGGSGAAGFSIDDQSPVQVSQQGSTSVYRFWTKGTYSTGDVQVTFISGKVGFSDHTTSSFTGPVAPGNFTVGGVATPNLHYLDVQLKPTAGDVILPLANNITLTGAGTS
jgi:hypothetical protein